MYLLNPEHAIVVCTPQGDEGGSRKAACRSGREETPFGKWKTHYPRESQKEGLLLQQVIISIPLFFTLSFPIFSFSYKLALFNTAF